MNGSGAGTGNGRIMIDSHAKEQKLCGWLYGVTMLMRWGRTGNLYRCGRQPRGPSGGALGVANGASKL
jgi:hypothetical protein